jgi:hypothetical protein
VTQTGGELGRIEVRIMSHASGPPQHLSSDDMTCAAAGCSLAIDLAAALEARSLTVEVGAAVAATVRVEVTPRPPAAP